MIVSPKECALYVPPGLADFKLALFERIGDRIRKQGGQVIRHDPKLIVDLPDDVVPIIGCSPVFRQQVLHDWPARGRRFIFWDRGYLRRIFATWLPAGYAGGYYRWTVNAFQMKTMRDVPNDRWKELRLDQVVLPWRKRGEHIVIADTGPDYWDLFAERDWAKRTAIELRKYTSREIVIRAKDDSRSLHSALDRAHALVSHGSIAAVEAVVLGCPVFVHEFSAAKLVGQTDLSRIETPIFPDRQPWLNSLAYSQFSENELIDGTLFRLMC